MICFQKRLFPCWLLVILHGQFCEHRESVALRINYLQFCLCLYLCVHLSVSVHGVVFSCVPMSVYLLSYAFHSLCACIILHMSDCVCVCLPACLCAYALVHVCGCVTLCVVPFVHNDMHDIIFDCEPLILQSLKIVPSPHNLFLDGWCNIVNTSGRYFRSYWNWPNDETAHMLCIPGYKDVTKSRTGRPEVDRAHCFLYSAKSMNETDWAPVKDAIRNSNCVLTYDMFISVYTKHYNKKLYVASSQPGKTCFKIHGWPKRG